MRIAQVEENSVSEKKKNVSSTYAKATSFTVLEIAFIIPHETTPLVSMQV